MKKQLFKSNSPETLRMFRSDFFEFFSKCPWWVPISYWTIVLSAIFYTIATNSSLSIWHWVGYLVVGLLAWSLLEYTFHRFIFHWNPSENNKTGQRLQFIMHGVHHDYPNDKLRLVTPPALSSILSIPLFCFYWVILPDVWSAALMFCGSMIGFLSYDYIHFYLHHGKITNNWVKKLQADHLSHHYANDEKRFGVTPFGVFWDNIFGTK